MPIFFLMRQHKDKSYALKALNNIIRAKGNRLILSTAYVSHELIINPKNKFEKSFKEWFKTADIDNKLELVIVGGKIEHKSPFNNNSFYVCNPIYDIACDLCRNYTIKSGCHQYSFKQFIEQIERWIPINKKRFISVKFAKAKNNRYHAKVALKYLDKEPIMALSGSSNITRPALEEGFKYYNYESDILVYTKQTQYFKNITKKVIKLNNCEQLNQNIRELVSDLYWNISQVSEILNGLKDEDYIENKDRIKLMLDFLEIEDIENFIRKKNYKYIEEYIYNAKELKREIEKMEEMANDQLSLIMYSPDNKKCVNLLKQISNSIESFIGLKTVMMKRDPKDGYCNDWK